MSGPSYTCEVCGMPIEGYDMDAFVAALTAHARNDHDWPYPDVAIRNFAEATQRATGPKDRLDSIGSVEVHRVTEERLDDWATFFDRDAFADNFAWAACYCAEPFLAPGDRSWRENRAEAEARIRDGRSYGYLAYVDGRPGGWVNASLRSEYAMFSELGGGGGDTIGLSCFLMAPPYRGHGLARRLLEVVVADAPGRGAAWIEAYPFHQGRDDSMPDFRGSRTMFEAAGFEEVERRDRYSVMRKPVG